MPEIKYDVSKGSDKCTVVTDDGATRAQLVNVVQGQVIYDETKSSDEATVVLDSGESVRAKIINNVN